MSEAYVDVVLAAIKAEEECLEPNRGILKSLRKQLIDALTKTKPSLEKPFAVVKNEPLEVRAFFAHHPILRAICGGAVLVRVVPKERFMPDAMRWTIYDHSSVLVRVGMTGLEASNHA